MGFCARCWRLPRCSLLLFNNNKQQYTLWTCVVLCCCWVVCCRYPSTMHGAFATGMREAANVIAALTRLRGGEVSELTFTGLSSCWWLWVLSKQCVQACSECIQHRTQRHAAGHCCG